MDTYEKKYKEALEWLREGLYPATRGEIKEEMERYFPELKESEDEKIRKYIIDYFKGNKGDLSEGFKWNGTTIEQVLTWLEKQGKKKSISKIPVSEKLYEHIRNTCACIDDALSSETLADINDYLSMAEHSAKSAFDMIEKQGQTFTKKDVDDAYLKGISDTKNELEKQGKQKTIDKIQIGKEYKCIASPRYSTFMIGKIYKPEDKFLCSLMNFCSDCFEPIEDGEQKLAVNTNLSHDKIEGCRNLMLIVKEEQLKAQKGE